MTARKPYPSDVSDEEWALVAPYLCLLREDAPQRTYSLREVFNGLRYLVRYGVAWRAMPNDLPPWHAVYDQAVRWLRAGCLVVHPASWMNFSGRSWFAGQCRLAEDLEPWPFASGLSAPKRPVN
jgi:transposase